MAVTSKISGKAMALLFGTAVAAGGAGVLIKDDQGEPMISGLLSPQSSEMAKPGEQAPAAKPEEKSEELASLPDAKADEAEVEPAVEPESITPNLPAFDVLRVEKDGSVVVAGRAPANSMVEILADAEVVATGKAGATGEFAIVFDDPLSAGDHELLIRATPEGGEPIISAEAGIVTVPEAGDATGEVMVMVQKSGEASRILQAPEAVAAEEKPAEQSTEVAALEQPKKEAVETTETANVASESAPKIEENQTEQASAEESVEVPETAEPVEAKTEEAVNPVLVQAVDVEPNKVFVAGKGEPGSFVRVYINGELKGTAKVAPTGAFLFEMNEGLEAGKHDLRVDALGSDGAEVVSRVAVVIEHEAEAMAVAETKTEEPVQQSAENTSAEPKQEVTKEAVIEAEPDTAANEEPAEVKPETVVAETTTFETSNKTPAKIGDVAAVEVASTEEDSAGEPTSDPIVKPATQTAEVKPEVAVEPEPKAESTAEVTEEAKPVIVTGRSVIIRRGDNLWRISRRMLGEGRKYTMIFSANANQIEDPDRIYPGQVFDVPNEDAAKATEAQKDAG